MGNVFTFYQLSLRPHNFITIEAVITCHLPDIFWPFEF